MTVEVDLVVPLSCRLEEPGLTQIRLENVHVDFKAEPRPVRHGYESLVDDRVAGFIRPFYTVEEGLIVGLMILDGQARNWSPAAAA